MSNQALVVIVVAVTAFVLLAVRSSVHVINEGYVRTDRIRNGEGEKN
jgi:hypothetical protein